MSKHRILGFKPQLRLEWRGQDSQHETQQPDHSASHHAINRDVVFGTRRREMPLDQPRLLGYSLLIRHG
jgi:hypothetical protein